MEIVILTAVIAATAMAIALLIACQAIKRLQRQAASQKIITDELMSAVNTLLEVSREHTRSIKELVEEVEAVKGDKR